MLKLAAFTSLLLMGSLIMLAATPTVNIFSNVLAQEYDKYGDSYYSTYQTDDKKYECRTGPFEGFFVGSVEFCKFKKFENDDKDRKDIRVNQTGTQGLQGPPGSQGDTGATGATGPQGIQGIQGERGLSGTTGRASTVPGPQGERGFNGTQGLQGIPGNPGATGMTGLRGPAGPNQINSTSIYTVPGPFNFTNEFRPTATSIAECLPGDTVLCGSFNIQFFGLQLLISDFALPTQDGWQTTISRQTGTVAGGDVAFNTFVQCFNNP